jgi:uncharacterized membrane protein
MSDDQTIQREKIETLLGNLLRLGVVLSLITMLTGLVLLFIQNPGYFHSANPAADIIGTGQGYPHTPLAVIAGAIRFDGPSMIMLGVFLLIATPVMRVLTASLAFAMQRDWVFTVITTTVLTILIIAFLLGRAR